MGLGYSRKELGKLHKEFYEIRFKKSKDEEAFQRALLSMIKGLLDVIDANNRKLEEDMKELLENNKKP